MSLSENERQIIVNRELEKAQRTYDDMDFNAREGKWEAAANRLYYALFHAISALLIYDGHNVKSRPAASSRKLRSILTTIWLNNQRLRDQRLPQG